MTTHGPAPDLVTLETEQSALPTQVSVYGTIGQGRGAGAGLVCAWKWLTVAIVTKLVKINTRIVDINAT